MTSGIGIAHSELSLKVEKNLHGVQLWIALPFKFKDVSPHFEHHGELPNLEYQGLKVKVIMGSLLGKTSSAKTYTPKIGRAHV